MKKAKLAEEKKLAAAKKAAELKAKNIESPYLKGLIDKLNHGEKVNFSQPLKPGELAHITPYYQTNLTKKVHHNVKDLGYQEVKKFVESINSRKNLIKVTFTQVGIKEFEAIRDGFKVGCLVPQLELHTLLDKAGLEVLASAIKNSLKFKAIILAPGKIELDETKLIAEALNQNPYVEYFSLRSSSINREKLGILIDMLKSNSNLSKIHIKGRLSEEVVNDILELVKVNKTLTDIHLEHSDGATTSLELKNKIKEALSQNTMLTKFNIFELKDSPFLSTTKSTLEENLNVKATISNKLKELFDILPSKEKNDNKVTKIEPKSLKLNNEEAALISNNEDITNIIICKMAKERIEKDNIASKEFFPQKQYDEYIKEFKSKLEKIFTDLQNEEAALKEQAALNESSSKIIKTEKENSEAASPTPAATSPEPQTETKKENSEVVPPTPAATSPDPQTETKKENSEAASPTPAATSPEPQTETKKENSEAASPTPAATSPERSAEIKIDNPEVVPPTPAELHTETVSLAGNIGEN
ncbi:MAG: hypothetical protein K0R02_151 [Rickettsiaceae bacterium]|nr:hypothetical protein [Rickettsiaceae bacterium]